MKHLLTTNLKSLLLVLFALLAVSAATAQSGDINVPVFVTGDNNIIQLGIFIETTPGNVPVSIYYNQQQKIFYYTWYSPSKGYYVLKAYDSYGYTLKDYWGRYYELGYSSSNSSSY